MKSPPEISRVICITVVHIVIKEERAERALAKKPRRKKERDSLRKPSFHPLLDLSEQIHNTIPYSISLHIDAVLPGGAVYA